MQMPMKCPNCGAVMRYLSSGKIYYCEYCKYEMRDKEERAAATDETEPWVVREIHHVYETSRQVPQYTRTRKKRSASQIIG